MEWNPLLLWQAGKYAKCCTAECGALYTAYMPPCTPASLTCSHMTFHTHTHSLDKACTLSTTQQVALGTLFAAYAHTHNHGQSSQQQATGSRSCVLGDKSHGKASLPTVQHQLQCQHADHALKVAQVCWTRPEESRHGLVRTCHRWHRGSTALAYPYWDECTT